MPDFVDAATFLALRDAGLPVFDARSPAEYAHAHMAGACNLPVLSNEERAAVGTAHARSGSEGAVHLALQLVGPQLAGKLARARQLFQDHLAMLDGGKTEDKTDAVPPTEKRTARDLRRRREVLVHCWRGGMRSNALAWLLEIGGFHPIILTGGYKAYRTLARAELAHPRKTLILGGMTGSGKTDILHALAAMGAQVIDLEGLAGHRGSAFGGVGLTEQPGNETVENALHEQWRNLDPARPVWLEDEDRRIGTVSLCGEFFEHIRTGPLVLVDVPFAVRVERLVRLYTGPAYKEALTACVARLRPRLGDEAATRCQADIAADRYHDAVVAALTYYDKLYQRQIDKLGRPLRCRMPVPDGDAAAAALRLIRMEKELAGRGG